MDKKKKDPSRLLPWKLIRLTLDVFNRLSLNLVRLKITPNWITSLGLVAGITAGVLFALELPLAAAAAIALSGALDILDGLVAKNSQNSGPFGAVFDSSLDRYTEFFILCGLAYHFRDGWGLWLMFFAFLGSIMVSYVRAKAESFGIPCKVGFMQRAERLVLILAGTVIGAAFGLFDTLMLATTAFIAVVSNLTALQRLYHVRSETKKHPSMEV